MNSYLTLLIESDVNVTKLVCEKMASNRSASLGNKFVTVRRMMSADEQQNIKSLFVKVGKIGGFIRSRGRSAVWSYFGELCFNDESGVVSSVDAQRHYCSPCLKEQQTTAAGVGIGHMSKVQSYTLSTATATLADHLRCAHGIKLSKVG